MLVSRRSAAQLGEARPARYNPVAMQKMTAALNEHIKLELAAWYEYAGMALWLELHDLPGFASFMKSQADDELLHAYRVINHLTERDQTPVLPALGKPRDNYESVLEVFQEVLKAEQTVTASINRVWKLAEEVDDQPARIMLEWFISEQVEEENVARAVIARLKLAGPTGPGLLLVDQEMASGNVPGAMAEPPA